MEGGNAVLLSLVVLGLMVVFERGVVPRWQPSWYFRLGLPLGATLVDLPHAPAEEGRTHAVDWRADAQSVWFWARPGRRGAPVGLHGWIRLVPRGDGRVGMEIRWSPPWIGVLACFWLAGIGVAQDDARFAGPLSMVLLAAIFLIYRQAAVRLAAELRYSLIKDREGDR